MKKFYFLLFSITVGLFSCNHSPGTDASTMIPSSSKNLQPGDDFRIYTEPKTGTIIIEFTSKEKGQAMLSVYYSDGKLLNRRALFVNKGMNSWDYQFPFRASGIYIVKFVMKDLERTGKVFRASS
jgi:hypothetical protein